MADVGTATLSECVEIAGWIADSGVCPGRHAARPPRPPTFLR
jgi:hypothetical protein